MKRGATTKKQARAMADLAVVLMERDKARVCYIVQRSKTHIPGMTRIQRKTVPIQIAG